MRIGNARLKKNAMKDPYINSVISFLALVAMYIISYNLLFLIIC